MEWCESNEVMRQVYKLEKQRYEVLYHKKKFKRYTDIQKNVIVKDYILNKNIKETSHKYNVPVSSIYKFIRDSKIKIKNNLL